VTIRKVNAGMTLIEIMIVLAIIGLVAAIGGPIVFNIYENAKVNATKQSIRGVQNAIKLFNLATQAYPQKLKDLVTRPADPDVAANWGPKPYMDKEPIDSWGKKFVYKLTPDGEHEYELYSYGSGGKKAPKAEWINVWKLK